MNAIIQIGMLMQQSGKVVQDEIGYGFFAERARGQGEKRLHGQYAQVYSQHFEDGYIAEIFSRIGTRGRNFLEFGVETGVQNTTRFLLEQGWSGVWVEGSQEHAAKAKEIFAPYVEAGQLKIIQGFITRENVNQILDEAGVEQAFDLITVDVDYNTSHIWRALNRTARVYCIEYNASIPPSVALEVPYEPSRTWDGTNFFGAGLKTMELIGRQKQMSLVGCDLQGVNAYFVSEKECEGRFCEPFTAENHHEMARYSLLTHIGHPASTVCRSWSQAL